MIVETDRGRVRAGAAVLAVGSAARGIRPLRSRLSVTSSHIVLTEPVPDVLEQLGWTGGECITDGRLLVHYFRTTRDGRIAFGWGGGRIAYGARLHGRMEVDGEVARDAAEQLVRLLPQLEGRRLTHAWGGPIDVSPSHIPQIGTLPGVPVSFALGYTGNGVGPSYLAGQGARLAGARPSRRGDAAADRRLRSRRLGAARAGRLARRHARALGAAAQGGERRRRPPARSAHARSDGPAAPVRRPSRALNLRLGVETGPRPGRY